MAFAMGIVGFFGFAYKVNFGAAASMIAQTTYETGLAYALSVIPLFILMGNFVVRGAHVGRAVSRRLHLSRPPARRPRHVHDRRLRRFRRDLRLVDRHRRDFRQGGLPVDAQVRLQGQPRCGSIAAGGTLGILIPPSVIMVIYGS